MKIKYNLLLAITCFAGPLSKVCAQLKTTNNSLFISAGTTITVSGLSITPSVGTSFDNNEISYSYTWLEGSPNKSIVGVYNTAAPFAIQGTVIIAYEQKDLNGNAENLLQITHAGTDKAFSVPSNKSSVDMMLNHVYETVDWKNASYITATSSGSALPVTLIDFEVAEQENDVVLTWSTSFEANSDFFEIQHSLDGKNWFVLGEVKSSGDSRTERTYSYRHEQPLAAEHYYRLRMVDNNGSFALSRIRHIQMESELAFAFHPNPVSDWLTIKIPSLQSPDNIKIISQSGRVVYEAKKDHLQRLAENAINLKQLTSGVYVIQVQERNGTLHSSKFIKN